MESYCVFLIGSFVALPRFQREFGIPLNDGTGNYVIETKWQSALQVSGQLGALIGVFLAGPLTSWIGYRWATISALMLLNVFIFAFYYAESMPVIFAAQILEGLPWGIFIANAPAYCSEIVPIQLRAPATQMLQMFWAIGSIIVGAVTYCYKNVDDSSAYKYVPTLPNSDTRTHTDGETAGSLSRSSGCFPPLSPSSCSSLPSPRGGWSGAAVSKRPPPRSSASVAVRS